MAGASGSAQRLHDCLGQVQVSHQWHSLVDGSTADPVAVGPSLPVILPRDVDDQIDFTGGDQVGCAVVGIG